MKIIRNDKIDIYARLGFKSNKNEKKYEFQ